MSNPTSFIHRHRKAIAQVITAVYLANPLLVTAQVILNANTPNDGRRAFVDQTQNGITKVNIASPNASGVSHNTYQQFDVPKAGVILNNGATNSNTRLAGWVEGNPNLLLGQEAKLILNEVVGGKPSQLQGYVEVAGKKADVIIANEHGVTCNGCGFINTERTTLTTGKPVFNGDGSLGQLRVEQGPIQIGTEGLQATGSRLDILSRYANVQGTVNADQINVVTGNNAVDYASGQITRLQVPVGATSSGLDVGQMGGMYANQITLMATGQGVGVNLDGQLLGAGQVSIQSDGTLQHKGTTQGDGGIRIEASELTQTGYLQSQQTIQVQAGKLNNSGTVQTGQQALLYADNVVQAGTIQANKIQINATGKIDNSGTLTAGADGLSVQAGATLDNRTTGRMQSQAQTTLQAGKLNNSGTLQATQEVQLRGDDMVQAGAIQARKIQINATGNIDNSGTLTAGADGLSVQAGATLDNRTTGSMQSQAQITMQAAQLNNAGQIMAQSDVRLQAQDLQNNATIQAVGQLTAQAQRIQNSATLLANGVTLTSQTLSNSGRIEGERLTLQAQDTQSTLINSGQIAGSSILIQGHAQLNNTGKISTAVDATVSTDNLQNLNIQVGQLNNNGGQLIGHNRLELQTEQLDNRSGTIATIDGDLRIQSDSIDNRSGQILQQGATKVMHLRATGALHNGSGQIEGQGQTLTLEAAELSNNSGQIQHTATVQAGQTEPVMTVTVTPSAHGSGQLQNIQGTLSATGQLRLQAHALITDASDPRRSASTTLQFMDKAAAQSGSAPSGSGYDWQADIAANEKANAAKAEADQKATQAQTAAQQLTQANTLLSQTQTQKTTTASTLTQAQANLTAAQAQATAAQAAAQAAPQDTTLAQAAQTAQAQVSTAQTAVNQAQTADQQAQISLTQAQADAQVAQASKAAADSANATAQAAYLAAQADVKTVADGTSGSNTSAPDAAKPTNLQLSAPTSPAAISSGSLVQAGRTLTLTLGAGGLDNRQGRLQAQDIQVQSQGDIWAGQINAQNSLSLQADHIEAEQRIQATSARINAQRLNNTGRIEGTQELQVEAQRLDNSGTLQSANTQLQGQTPGSPTDLVLNNSGLAQGYVNLTIDGVQVLNTGTLSAGQAQIRGTDQLENRGVIFSTGNMTLQGQDIVNNQARIYSMGDLTLEGAQAGQAAGSVFNYVGRIEAQGDVNINTDTLTNRAVLPSVNQRGFVEHIRDGGNIITRATDTFNADGKKAEIIAGKKLNITAKTVNNDYGILSAWHQVNITADTLNNTAYGAIQTENMVVKAACYNCHQTVRYADSWGGRIESGGAANLRALVVNNKTTDTRDGFAGLSTDPRVVIVDERSGTQSPLTKAFVDRFGIVTGPSTAAGENAPAPLPGPRLLSDNLVLTAYGRFDFSRFVLPDGKTGLFELADPASPYLIQGRTDLIPRETGAQNTVYNQFLGSDYLMTRLGLIPGGAKRLGDAWYETQLVQEQLYALSGRRYLVAGTTSDYDLMRSLMDAGLLAQAQLRLVAGDPLSPEQQQALKQDMVWPEWQDVAGQRVLVPKVYLAQKQDAPNSEERQVGALIAGQSVDIQTTELNQSNGHIAAGGPLNINAKGAVQGSGSYSGGTSVAVVAGNIDLANASVQSSGWLKLQTTQGDLNLAATQVKAAGDATLQSAGALNLTAQKHEAHVVRGDGSKKDEVQYETTNIQAGGSATITSVGDLTAQGSTITAAQDLKLQSTGGSVDLQAFKNSSDTSSTSTSGMRLFARTSTTTTHTEAVQGTQLQAGGNAQVLAAQNLSAQSLQLQAGGNATLAAAGTLALTSEQAYSRTQTGSDVRQSLQTERSQIQAGGNATLYGQQAVQMGAADVRAGGNAQVTSQGAVILDANTDTEQRNWTTSSSSSTWYGKTKTTTTQRQTLDQEAERTRINAGQQAVVLGGNVLSVGAQVQGKSLTQIEGADQTLLYDVQEVHQYSANSQTSKGFLGITYSKSTSQDSRLQSKALPTEIKSDQAVRVGVGAVTDVRGAVLTAPQVEFYRSANADTTQPGELILGVSTNTSQTSHTEKTVTAGVWQKQEGQGQTSQTANQTQINGQLVIGQGIQTKVQIPEGPLKSQIEALSQQPGQGYLKDLASNPNVNWAQVKLVHDQWSYSQQGLTGAGAALLAIVVAYATGGMGSSLVGTTTATATGTATTLGGTTLATTTAATATAAASATTFAAGAAINAGFSALASSAAVSFVNNGGDLGQTFKDLGSKDSVKAVLLSMASAGALQSLNQTLTIDGQKLSAINAKDSTFAANLGKNVVNNMASATMTSALTGTSLEDSLKTALTSAVISAGAGQTANTIGNMTQDSQAVKALAHALAGCVAGAAGSGSQGCQSGAVGAVVGELAAQWVNPTDDPKKMAQTLELVKVLSAAAGAITGDGSAASVNTAVMTGVNAALNNRMLHPTEANLIKNNAKRYAQERFGTVNPSAQQIEAAQVELANTAQSMLDNNLGTVVPYIGQAADFLAKLKVEYMQQYGSLNLAGTAGGAGGTQQLFYATVEQKNLPWLNQGLADPAITGLIVKTPINPPKTADTQASNRDRLTGLALDDKGRYEVNLTLGDKSYSPKFYPCATAECVKSGGNLDMSDAGTRAYVQALDKGVFSGIGTGATAATLVTPTGAAARVLFWVGAAASGGQVATSDKPIDAAWDEFWKAASEKGGEKFFTEILGHTPSAAARATALINLSGGWDAFVNRVKVDFLGARSDDPKE